MKHTYHRPPDVGMQIDLKNGHVLRYKIDDSTKRELQNALGEIDTMEEGGVIVDVGVKFMSFTTYRQRLILLNVDEISRITFTSADRFISKLHDYVDNFNLVPSQEQLKAEEEEYGPMPDDNGEQILPHAVIYHTGEDGEDSEVENPFVFEELQNGDLLLSKRELNDEMPMPDFIRIRDQSDDYHYIPSSSIICMEVWTPIIEE